jgi:hypothetical protein
MVTMKFSDATAYGVAAFSLQQRMLELGANWAKFDHREKVVKIGDINDVFSVKNTLMLAKVEEDEYCLEYA